MPMPLPPLREELDLLPGAPLADGQPSWTLHDPVRNLFFRIDWPTLEILTRWHFHDAQAIAHSINQETTLDLGPEDVEAVIQFVTQHQLIQRTQAQAPRHMAEQLSRIQGSPLKWLLHHYLFFRVPLVKPDAWLAKWLPVARWFGSATFRVATALALLFGMGQVLRQWDVFVASLVDTFSFEGLLAYGVALICVKVVHELGHAFTARHYGCRVPAMGVAFLVMWPVAYTDTNETWRLTDRTQRLRVASAGIATELVIAVWATAAWALMPAGGLQSAAFVLATTSWVATLAINASPFMRFDGYFILMDMLDMPNLHSRSFALARWSLREWLFDLGDDPPEWHKPSTVKAMIAFAWATWLYRLVLFLGIALLVYHFFFKALGVFLFAVEIMWFILKPIASELAVWRQRWTDIRRQKRLRRPLALGVLLCVVLALPWPGRISASAVLRPQAEWPVFSPVGARIDGLPIAHGAAVNEGDLLLELGLPDINNREQVLALRMELQRWQAATAGFNEDARKRWLVHEQTLATTETEWHGLQAERSLFQPLAPYSGRFYLSDPDLAVGQWVGKKEWLGSLVSNSSAWKVETWLNEEDISRLRLGQDAFFWPDNVSASMLHLTVTSIDEDATRRLPRGELASDKGGHIATREKNGQVVPEQAVYRVTLAAQDVPADISNMSWRGQVTIHADWVSPAKRYANQMLAVLVREFGF